LKFDKLTNETDRGTMRILGIDSSTPGCSVALLNSDKIVAERIADPKPSYSKYLLQMVDQVLTEGKSRLDDVDGFAVTIGPGSFTGLRIGVSLLKGFVLATEKPFVGINSLEALACTLDAPEHPICTALDARKSEVYAAVFESRKEGLHPLIKESALSPEALCEKIKAPMLFIGNGVERYRDFFKESLGKLFMEPEAPPRFSTAAGTAMLASRQFDHQHHFDLNQLKINYIRKSEAELSLGR
jgi:tRNA threonylcarbamoyladenosine biosynthesis protein TsaB